MRNKQNKDISQFYDICYGEKRKQFISLIAMRKRNKQRP